MTDRIFRLKPAQTITATKVNATGHIRRADDKTIGALVTASHTFGPYAVERDFIVQGDVSVTIAEADLTANIPSAAQAAALDAIPATDQEDSATVWNDAGILKVSGAGA